MNSVIHALEQRDLLGLVDDVCCRRHVTHDEVCSGTRTKAIANARHELWWRLRHHPNTCFSYPEIGRLFGRHHATVIHGVRTYERRLHDAQTPTAVAAAERAQRAAAERAR